MKDDTWPLGLRIRPAAETSSVEVSDTVTGRRFRWSPEALAGLILDDERRAAWTEGLRDPGSGRDELAGGWRHWQERGWFPSDQYYVASRRWVYADSDDPRGEVRTAALQDYLAASGPPPAEVLPDGPVTELDPPARPADRELADLLTSRRTGRRYRDEPVPSEQLSGVLWHGLTGVRERRERISESDPLSYLDSFGSAWDVHVCVYAVDGVEPGAYRYDLLGHRLIATRPGDHRHAMIDVLQGQRSPSTAAWTIGLVADFPRYQWRYRHEHGLRRLYLESGVLGQELAIVAHAYGLSTLITPAQKDRAYLALHGDLPDDRYAPVYTLTMGRSLGTRGHFLADPGEPA
ncbi:SagB/ThcOx family dehydrogenase [Actinoplanes sp. LDG1-06]|uniref:SagB/ThcOx family dehydrogenase n=1 Tax=Paractinoplanes ovalisporus TaxID=2810368 RepID=A0ABS2A4N2_9ACTN|nr:SagB/ThcOx family dehydrogenase [Actinoplanes ovalisporus]MBM2614786.1 SagB/ThcOx family dehydrogenase [Actinoplanes ovalisporus]